MSALLALCLILVGGPGWAAVFCACSGTPKAVCCCDKDHGTNESHADELRVCRGVEVEKVSPGTSAERLEVTLQAPPHSTPSTVLPPVVEARPSPAAPSVAPDADCDPPFIRLRSLRC